MSKAYEFSSSIITIFDEVDKLYKSLNKELSYCDILRNDILHKIELENFTIYEGYLICKKLKEISCKRRKVKDELEPLHTFHHCIKNFKAPIEKSNKKVFKIDKSRKYRKYVPKLLHKDTIT